MKKIFAQRFLCYLLSASFIPGFLYAQNLVLNPSFEKKKDLISNRKLEKPIHAAKHWLNPNAGQPKIYGSKRNGFIFDKEGTSWNFKAKSGKHVAAIFVYGNNPVNGSLRRDYIQGLLSQPLEVGKKYYFSFWVHYHCEGSDNIGISFLPEWNFLLRSGLLELEADAYQKELNNYSRDASWAIVQDSFIATHAYETFIIGNFFSNEDTRVESDNIGHHLAYIDDISVKEALNPDMPGKLAPSPVATLPKPDSVLFPVKEEVPVEELAPKRPREVQVQIQVQNQPKTPIQLKTPEPEAKTPIRSKSPIEPKPPIIKTYVPVRAKPVPPPGPTSFLIQPVFFAYDSPVLRKKYQVQLSSLVTHLKKHPHLHVLIKGYASEEGGTMYNFELAMDRAEQSKLFLRSKGISPERMYIRIIGEKVGPEDLAKGRSYNRRVDFEVLE